jgi:signal transduction histidine kinase
MRLLQNPIIINAAITFVLTCAFVAVGILLIRRMRRHIHAGMENSRVEAQRPGFSLAAYEGVITRLKEQERELERLRRSENERAKESATVSEAIISNLPSGVLLFNTAGLVRQANPAARTLLGFASPSSLHARDIFKTVTAVRPPEAAPGSTPPDALVALVQKSIAEGALFRRIEADYVTPSGDRRVLGITISPVRLASGERLGAACLVSDLTDIALLSEQIKLKQSMAALGEMSAGIAHEFKNSLATISGYAQMLAADQPQGAQDFASRIVAETEGLARIVSDFLKFAKPQGAAREEINLFDLVMDCAREAKVEIGFSLTGELMDVLGDPTALRQAVSNLFRNSVEAAAPEKAKVLASFKSTPTGVSVSLIDNGGGIPPENLDRIFIPFFTTKPQGTGLGLALVHRIVTEQGGTITVESPFSIPSHGTGTAFTLAFPHAAAAANTGAAPARQG